MRLGSITERTAFFVTLVAVLVLALLPVPRLEEFGLDVGFHYDKLNHFTAFAVLTFLGGLGWPERKVTMMIFLSLVGAAIEVLQGTALIGRDLEGLDWVADCIGIVCGGVVLACITRLVRRAN
jgi:hypothetical protein